MSTIELKYSLHNLIDTIEDKSILSGVYALLKKVAPKSAIKEEWDSLPDEVKEAIEEGIAQADRGEGIPYEVFMKEVRSKYHL